MRIHTIVRPALVAAVLVFLATTVNAQAPIDTFDGLQKHVKAGDRITVTGGSGGVFEGRLLDLSISTLTVNVDGMPREFSIDDVRSITRARHADVRKTAWWGFGIGAGLGLIALPASECRIGADCAATAARMAFVTGGLFAAAGAGFAAATPRNTVIFARAGSGAKLSLAPVVSRERLGAQVSVRF
jgi:hypothetical protein